MPNYKKRKSYQTGGSTKPKKISQAQMDAMQKAAAKMRKERGLMELGNRQRAAAAKARARSGKGPTRAEAERNRAEYERAMRARQEARGRALVRGTRTPTAQQRADYERMVREIQNRNRPQARPPSTSINVGGGKALPAMRERSMPSTGRPASRPPQMRTTPRPSMSNQVRSRENASERRRIQQQIAQLQARLRQLGG